MKYFRPWFLLFLTLSMVLSSCVIPPGHLKTLRGNYHFLRGEFQEAMLSYLSLANETNVPWAQYNLANTYYYLGENDLASAVWGNALSQASDELKFDLLFSMGLVEFEAGKFLEARDLFTQALLLRPQNEAVRLNLELSHQNLQVTRGTERDTNDGNSLGGLSAGQQRVLEYVSRKEARPWEAPVLEVETTIKDW